MYKRIVTGTYQFKHREVNNAGAAAWRMRHKVKWKIW